MESLGLLEVYEHRFIELVQLLGLLEPDEPALVDSVPVRGAGQVLDAHNLIAAAIRSGLKRLGKVTGESDSDVAERLELTVFLARTTLTCPAGHQLPRSRFATRQGKRGWLFEFPYELCRGCPAMADCVNPKAQSKGRSVFIVEAEERLIRAHLERRREVDFRDKLAQRVKVEHTIAGFAQCGGRRVRRFRQDHADFDVRLSALAYNLRRLGSVLRQRPELLGRLHELVAAARRSEDGDDEASGRPPLFFFASAGRARGGPLAAAFVLLALLTCAMARRRRSAAWPAPRAATLPP